MSESKGTDQPGNRENADAWREVNRRETERRDAARRDPGQPWPPAQQNQPKA